MVLGAGWQTELRRWLAPCLEVLGHPARRAMCPLYVAGLIGPGERKSVQPMAERLGLPGHDALHHFLAGGVWDAKPLELALMGEADRLVGGEDAWLAVDGTALFKKGKLWRRIFCRPASIAIARAAMKPHPLYITPLSDFSRGINPCVQLGQVGHVSSPPWLRSP